MRRIMIIAALSLILLGCGGGFRKTIDADLTTGCSQDRAEGLQRDLAVAHGLGGGFGAAIMPKLEDKLADCD